MRACVRRCVRACAALRFSAAGCTISRGCTSLARGSPRGFKRALSAVCRSALSRRGIVKTRRALDSKIMRDEVAHRSDRPIDRTTRVTKLSLMRRSIVKRGARFFFPLPPLWNPFPHFSVSRERGSRGRHTTHVIFIFSRSLTFMSTRAR